MRAQGERLREMLVQEKLDDNAIAKQLSMLSTSIANLVKAELQMNVTMMNELTADQRKLLVQMHEQWMERMKQRKGMRGSTTSPQAK